MRLFLLAFIFISTAAFAQRDTVIGGIKCHLVSESDTGAAWIQQKVATKKKGVKFRGVYFETYPGGKLKAKGYYRYGKRYQKWLRYYQSGQKSEEGYFDKGQKSDLWMTYYESGKMAWKGSFYKNMPSGFWRYFYEDGTLKAMTRYRIKTESVTKKAKKGAKGASIVSSRQINYTISPADSLVEYYPGGKLRTRIIYGKEGGLDGAAVFYYPDGTLNMEGQYLAGKATGEWKWYCTTGTLYKTMQYTVDEAVPLPADSCAYQEIKPWLQWEPALVTPK